MKVFFQKALHIFGLPSEAFTLSCCHYWNKGTVAHISGAVSLMLVENYLNQSQSSFISSANLLAGYNQLNRLCLQKIWLYVINHIWSWHYNSKALSIKASSSCNFAWYSFMWIVRLIISISIINISILNSQIKQSFSITVAQIPLESF